MVHHWQVDEGRAKRQRILIVINRLSLRQVGITIGLFFLALIPRIVGLQRFVTADEPSWLRRSAQFWLAVLDGRWQDTFIEPVKPAVTTMWTGGFGMWVYNRLHFQQPFSDFLGGITEVVDLEILKWARMPTVILTAIAIIMIYHFSRPLLSPSLALLAAVLLSLDPFLVAHSRFLHHDALATMAVIPALLLAIHASRDGDNWKAIAGSAVLAGLAFLTKSPSIVLIPFVGLLFLFGAWRYGQGWKKVIGRYLVWLLIAGLTFVALWPAAWYRPIGVVVDMIDHALIEGARVASIIILPDLGPIFYPVYVAFYITPVILVGLAIWFWKSGTLPEKARNTNYTLALFGALVIIIMTISSKRDARYVLPVFVVITLLAASGWYAWLKPRNLRTKWLVVGGLLLVQLLSVIPYAPYYISYLNPILGGPLSAPRIIRLGWGEGFDQVGAWLTQLPEAESGIVASNFRSTLRPFFAGKLVKENTPTADFTVLYIRQKFVLDIVKYAYYESRTPIKTFRIAGVEYADVYTGPGLQMLEGDGPLIAYRLDKGSYSAGQDARIELVWRSPAEVPKNPPSFSLRQDSQLHWLEEATPDGQRSLNGGETITNHMVQFPATELEESSHTLFLGDQQLGRIKFR
jgi:hypothetical protein